MVAGVCNALKILQIPFRFEIRQIAAWSRRACCPDSRRGIAWRCTAPFA